MSAIAYGALTRKREESTPGTSSDEEKPGIRPYIDTLAALVPAEVLGLHAFVLTLTTETETASDGTETTTITRADLMEKAWWAMLFLPIFLYAFGHFAKRWDGWDFVRMLIPAAAFAGWTMAQSPSAYDAVADWSMEARYIIVAIGTIALGAVAAALSGKADEKPKPTT
jgi:hypothetical protein